MKRLITLLAVAVMLVAPAAVKGQSTFYGYDIIGGGGLFTMTASTAGDFDGLYRPGINESVYTCFAMDFNVAETEIYAIDSTSNEFGTIDPTTGLFTIIGQGGDMPAGAATGLTTDPSSGTVYVCSATDLYTIDPATGITTFVATFSGSGGTPDIVIDIACDNSGNVFAFDFDSVAVVDNGRLWSVNTGTGVLTFVGSAGIDMVGFAQGMDFDPATNELYAAIFAQDAAGDNAGSYGTWDVGTGTFTEIAPLQATIASEYEMTIAMGLTFVQNFLLNDFSSFPVDLPSSYGVIYFLPDRVLTTMDWDATGTTLYGTDRTGLLGTIDPATGAFNTVAIMSGDWTGTVSLITGITCDPTTGVFYVADIGSLYTIDETTGVTTLVGAFGFGTTMVEIACDENGDLYGVNSGNSSLVAINKATGATTTAISAPGTVFGFIQGMDFDPDDGLLYGAHYNAGPAGSYGVWDLSAGTYTEILPLQSLTDPDADGMLAQVAIRPAQSIIDVVPDSVTLTTGVLTAGGVAELQASDNADYRASRNPNGLQPVIRYEVKSTSSIQSPSAMTFTIEESVFARGNVTRTIELFDYTAGAWVQVDSRVSSRNVDRVDAITIAGTVSQYVEPGTGCVEARVRYNGAVARAVYTANVDNIFWTIEN